MYTDVANKDAKKTYEYNCQGMKVNGMQIKLKIFYQLHYECYFLKYCLTN